MTEVLFYHLQNMSVENVLPPLLEKSLERGWRDVVDDFCRRTRFFKEPMTKGRARMFVLQHRLNTRQRNSVLKLKVATNCPDWDMRDGKADTREISFRHKAGHRVPARLRRLPLRVPSVRLCRNQ